jgi:hypothetical protein
MFTFETTRPQIRGFVSKGFEPIQDAFAENFAGRKELGAAYCVGHHGEKVVDLWGGIRNKATGEAWEEDTMVIVHSATKGLSAMTLALAEMHCPKQLEIVLGGTHLFEELGALGRVTRLAADWFIQHLKREADQ